MFSVKLQLKFVVNVPTPKKFSIPPALVFMGLFNVNKPVELSKETTDVPTMSPPPVTEVPGGITLIVETTIAVLATESWINWADCAWKEITTVLGTMPTPETLEPTTGGLFVFIKTEVPTTDWATSADEAAWIYSPS